MTNPAKPKFQIERRGRPKLAGARYPAGRIKPRDRGPDYGTPDLQRWLAIFSQAEGMTV